MSEIESARITGQAGSRAWRDIAATLCLSMLKRGQRSTVSVVAARLRNGYLT